MSGYNLWEGGGEPCPVCQTPMDGRRCPNCGHIESEPLQPGAGIPEEVKAKPENILTDWSKSSEGMWKDSAGETPPGKAIEPEIVSSVEDGKATAVVLDVQGPIKLELDGGTSELLNVYIAPQKSESYNWALVRIWDPSESILSEMATGRSIFADGSYKEKGAMPIIDIFDEEGTIEKRDLEIKPEITPDNFENISKGDRLDIVGEVVAVDDKQEVEDDDETPFLLRNIRVSDNTGNTLMVHLWEGNASFAPSKGDQVFLGGLRIRDGYFDRELDGSLGWSGMSIQSPEAYLKAQ